MRYHYIPIRLSKIEKIDHIRYVQRCGTTIIFHELLVGMKIVQSLCKTGSFLETHTPTSYDQDIPSSDAINICVEVFV